MHRIENSIKVEQLCKVLLRYEIIVEYFEIY